MLPAVGVKVARADEMAGSSLLEYHGSAVISELTWLKSISE